ncbi:MAG: ABC transporter substrate-binding protein [Bacteroidetes bacterium]|jgi:ABC-type branched-subunit amino acid transport system substrate-binding protein|nr:ABC transporter substrate-binding protein [Bacteroidota bacterium]
MNMQNGYNLFMKAFLTLLLLFTFIHAQSSAQSFSEAMEMYQDENYQQAAELFLNSDDDRSQLFAGKSFLALTDYSSAINHLRNASKSTQENIRQEALYSLAIAHFTLKNYDVSLEHLYELASGDNRTGLRSDAQRFYNQILNYLSIQDRYEILYKLQSPAIQFDLVRSSKPFMDAEAFRVLVNELVKSTGQAFSRQEIERELLVDLRPQTDRIEYPAPPEGMVYNIGVILPTFDENDPDFTIPRNLYYGMVLAADDFNERNRNQKVNLIFRNSAENADTTAAVFSELAWTKKIDAVIGPLFSEPASRLAQLSEEYQIPMLAPLANSDSLNLDYNYTFQMNPTFEMQGKKMAQFAVQELRLDTLGIITEEGSLGRNSALAFRHEAEKLGATISYYIEQDFAATGYDFSEVTDVFTSDPALIDSLNIRQSDAVFAPFTGQASTTMMNLLMNNLEAMDSNVTVLGTEQWEYAPLTDFQKRFFDVYYTQSMVQNPDSSSANFFTDDYETRFGTEPDRFSRIGYDTANYLFRSLETAGNPDYLSQAIRNGSIFNGLAYRIFFDGERVNQHLFIRSFSE